MNKKLCDGKINAVVVDAGKHKDLSLGWWCFPTVPTPTGIKRMRLKCPKCGRRILSSVELNHDGDLIFHTLPPHKPKGWWKKNGKNCRKKNENQIYRSTKR